jgi:hypothetical protein
MRTGLAAEADREAPQGVVPVDLIAAQAGGRRHAVAHAVQAQFRPALAPQIGGDLHAVDAGDQLGDSSARDVMRPCTSPTRNTVWLAPPFGTVRRILPASNMSTEIEAGDAAHHPPPADDVGDAFLVDAVLQRYHEAARRQVLAHQVVAHSVS